MLQRMWYMLDRESHPEPMKHMISELDKSDRDKVNKWITANLDKVLAAAEWDTYHRQELTMSAFNACRRSDNLELMLRLN